MGCATTSGYTHDPCGDGVGGMKTMYVINRADVTTITLTSGVVSTITKAASKRFWKYTLPRETASVKSTPSANVQNGSRYYTHEVSFVLHKIKAANRNEIQNLDNSNLLFVIVDENGTAIMLGKNNGLDLSGGETGTGTAAGDRNGIARTYTGNEPEDLITVTDNLISGLETPGT